MVLNFFKNKIASYFSLIFVVLSTAVVLFVDLDFSFFVLFLSLISFFALFFVKLEWIFYLVVFLFPVTTRFYGVFNFYAVDVISIIFIVIFILKFLYSLLFGEKIKINKPLLFPFVLFFISACLSIFNSFDKTHTLFWIGYLLFLYFAYIVLPVNIVNDKNKLFIVLNIFVFVGLIDAAAGALSIYSQIEHNVIYGATPISIFGKNFLGTSRNTLAQILVLTIPAALACFYLVKDKYFKRIYLMSAFFIAVINLLTLSRSTLISFVVVLFIIIVGSSYIYNKKNIDKVIVTFIFIASIFFAGVMYFYANSGREGFSGSLYYRVGVAEISVDMFNNNPIFGNGFGMFKKLLSSNSWHNLEYGWGGLTEAHSWAQKILVEQGVFGILTFVLFLFFIYYFSIKFIIDENISKQNRMIMVFLIAMATSQIVFNLFDWMYYNFRMWIPMSLPLLFMAINKYDLSITKLKFFSNFLNKFDSFILKIKSKLIKNK